MPDRVWNAYVRAQQRVCICLRSFLTDRAASAVAAPLVERRRIEDRCYHKRLRLPPLVDAAAVGRRRIDGGCAASAVAAVSIETLSAIARAACFARLCLSGLRLRRTHPRFDWESCHGIPRPRLPR